MQSKYTGLTTSEAHKLLNQNGKNIFRSNVKSPLNIFLKQFISPLVVLLLLAATISVLTNSYDDALIIFIIIGINSLLGFIQEYKSHSTIEKLKTLISSNVLVLRDGKEVLIPKANLVVGDVIFLKLGDIVPADSEVLEENDLLVDESSITGESKLISGNKKIYSGTAIKKGAVTAKVFATGKNSRFGEIAELSINTKKPSEYEQNLSKITRFIVILLVVFAILLFLIHLIIKPTNDVTTLLLFVVAISITIVPESLPLITSLTLSQAAGRMSKKSFIVKRLTSLEDLGNIDLICTDKTGTLTKNVLKVEKYITNDEEKFFKYSSLNTINSGDPFDISISEFLRSNNTTQIEIKEYKDNAFDPETKISSRAFKDFKTIKGAPEVISKLCNENTTDILKEIEKYQEEGLRAISICLKEGENAPNYLGTYLLQDEIKEGIEEVVVKLIKHKIGIKIITGDSALTSSYVGLKIGLIKSKDEVIDVSTLHFNNIEILLTEVEKYTIFARADPVQKYKIIEALEKKHFVGYLGDGINDSPALKLANVGIVVNNASDIAKSIADIVILNKSITHIVDGVVEGRKTFENIDKYIRYTLVGNFGNFFSIGILSLVLPFFPLLPLQILINNLIIDVASLSFAFDHVSSMDIRKPKHHKINDTIKYSILLAIIASLSDFVFFFLIRGADQTTMQSMWFIFTTLSEILIVLSLRTKRIFIGKDKPSKFLIVNIIFCLILTFGIAIFGFQIASLTSLSLYSLVFVILLSLGYFFVSEVVKLKYIGKVESLNDKKVELERGR